MLIDDKPIELVDSHRHLGVIFSGELKWSLHIQNVLSKCSRKVGLLKWMSYELPHSAILKLYLLYVRPSLEYAAPLWHASISSSDALALERLQCAIARLLLQAPWDTPKETLLRQIGWPSLRYRREIISMVLFFKLLRARPPFLSDCLFPFAHTRSERLLRKPFQLLLGKALSSRYSNSFFFRSAVLWNTLPHSLQSITNPSKFRSALEDHWCAFQFNTKSNIPV